VVPVAGRDRTALVVGLLRQAGVAQTVVGDGVEVCGARRGRGSHRPVRRGCAASGSTRSPVKRGHKYLVIVAGHDSRLLIWAAPGRDRKTLDAFSGCLGPDRAPELSHVSADGADWIVGVVADRAPQAVLCAGPFHVVSWATGALDEVRREVWRRKMIKNLPTEPAGGPQMTVRRSSESSR